MERQGGQGPGTYGCMPSMHAVPEHGRAEGDGVPLEHEIGMSRGGALDEVQPREPRRDMLDLHLARIELATFSVWG